MSEYNKCQWIVIGISGVTCGGKTTLANKLCEALSPVCVFNQDQYFYPDNSPHHVRCGNLDHNNYDILSAVNMEALRQDVMRALQGDEAGAHATGATGAIRVAGKRFLVIEGFTALNYKPISDLCNLKYYLTLDLGTCAARRALRLYDPPDVPGYFEQCVWPEHLKYKKEMKRDSTVRFLSGTDPDVLQHVLQDIETLIAECAAPRSQSPVKDPPCVSVGAQKAGGTDDAHSSHAHHSHGPHAHGHTTHAKKGEDGKGKKEPGCVGENCVLEKDCSKKVYP